MSLTATGAQLPWHDPGAAEGDKCCCGGGETCCLYPSSGIAAGDFFLADLPAAISYVDSGTPYSWGKLGAIQTEEVFAYNVGTGLWESIGDVSFCYDYSGGYFIGYKADGSSWVMVVYNAGDDRYEILFSIGPCLITGDGNLTPLDDTIEDQFEPTYRVTFDVWVSGVFDTSWDIEAERNSLCAWVGSTGDYGSVNLNHNPESGKFEYSVPDTGIIEVAKDDYQSSPDADGGTYADGAAGVYEIKNFVVQIP